MEKLKHNREHGFTLVELIVVLVILGIIAAIGIPSLTRYIDKVNVSKCEVSRTSLKAAYETAVMTEKNSGITPSIDTFEWEVMNALKLSDHQDMVTDGNGDGKPDGVSLSSSKMIIELTGLCGDNTVTAMRWRDGTLHLACSEHGGDELDATGSITQSNSYEDFLTQWQAEGNSITSGTDKASFFEEYYKTHEVVKMSEEYRQSIEDTLYNGKTNNLRTLYWWTYPVTDSSGNLLYTVTFANEYSDPTPWWSGSGRGNIEKGYVVIVNGKYYVRTKQANCVSPATSTLKYETENKLETALVSAGYKVMNP